MQLHFTFQVAIITKALICFPGNNDIFSEWLFIGI